MYNRDVGRWENTGGYWFMTYRRRMHYIYFCQNHGGGISLHIIPAPTALVWQMFINFITVATKIWPNARSPYFKFIYISQCGKETFLLSKVFRRDLSWSTSERKLKCQLNGSSYNTPPYCRIIRTELFSKEQIGCVLSIPTFYLIVMGMNS